MGYQRPDGTAVSASWQDHRDRTPPSAEPGTDYGCAYGTALVAADPGKVVDRKTSNSGATGRYVTVDLDDGRRVRYLHLATVSVAVGARVARGGRLGTSGASGNGSDWYYGPHVHSTLFPQQTYDFDSTIDFERYVGPEEDDMPGLKHVSIDRAVPQQIAGDAEYIRLNDADSVSLYTSGHDVVEGDFALRFDVVERSETAAASIQIVPYLVTLDSKGNETGATSLGTQEYALTTGSQSVHVRQPPVSMKDNQRIRFKASASDGTVVKIVSGVFRGMYWG